MQFTFNEVMRRTALVPVEMREFLRSCLRRVAAFPDADKNYPLWWFIYDHGGKEFVIGYAKGKRGEYIRFPYETLESFNLF